MKIQVRRGEGRFGRVARLIRQLPLCRWRSFARRDTR